jgi:acetyl esterase/lipase
MCLMRYADRQLEALALRPSPLGDEPDVEEVRAGLLERAAQKQPGPAMDTVRDLEAAGLPARLYRPRPEPLPLVLYLHAGGWTVGSIASADRLCRRLAVAADAAVLSLEYRLAPEHPWPASIDDAVATMRWIAGGPEALDGLGPWGALGDSAEPDPLRDELEAYAARLREAGNEVTARREPGMIHNFLQMDEGSPAAAAAGDRIGGELGEMLRAPA